MTLDERLENWGAIWRSRMAGQSLIADVWSTKRGYGNAWHWDSSNEVSSRGVHLGVAPRVAVNCDPVDAGAVERAVCAMDIFHHVILKAEYVRQWPPEKGLYEAQKAAGERRRTVTWYDRAAAYDASLRMARGLLTEIVDRPAVIRRQGALRLARAALAMPAWDDAYA